MTRTEFIQHLEQTYRDCITIVRKKNADYAADGDPFQNFADSQIISGVPLDRGILVRLGDKLSRVRNLLDRNPEVLDEKIEDTLNDAINYLAILKAYLSDRGHA